MKLPISFDETKNFNSAIRVEISSWDDKPPYNQLLGSLSNKKQLEFILYRLTIKQNLLKEIILDLLLLVMVMLNHVSKVSLMFLMVYIILIRCFKLEWMVKILTGSSFE